MAREEDAKEKKVGELSFKEASIELEQIVRQLETGDLELEEALERYSRGVELLRSLRGRLKEAEQKVEVLLGETRDDVPDTASAPSTGFLDE